MTVDSDQRWMYCKSVIFRDVVVVTLCVKKYRFEKCENWCYFMLSVNSNVKNSSTLRGQFGVGLDVNNERSRYLVSSKSTMNVMVYVTPALGVSSLLFCYF